MANQITQYIKQDAVQESIRSVLHNKTPQFIASVASLVSQEVKLAEAEPDSVLRAAMVASSLDLPINQSLGFAYIIAYKDTKAGKTYAQFQIGWRGLVQLAQRSGQFKTINVTDIREGEVDEENKLTGEIDFKFAPRDERDKLPIIGYVSYFKLNNGFEKILYMTVEQIKKHGLKYSKSFAKGFGPWKDDFESMASKTVLKLLLAKYAPMTVEMQTATIKDQAVITEAGEIYIDNEPITHQEVANDKEFKRVVTHITDAQSIKELEEVKDLVKEHGLETQYKDKKVLLEEVK